MIFAGKRDVVFVHHSARIFGDDGIFLDFRIFLRGIAFMPTCPLDPKIPMGCGFSRIFPVFSDEFWGNPGDFGGFQRFSVLMPDGGVTAGDGGGMFSDDVVPPQGGFQEWPLCVFRVASKGLDGQRAENASGVAFCACFGVSGSGFRSFTVFPAVLTGGSLHDAPGEGRGMLATVFSVATVVLLPVIEIYMILYTACAAACRIL